MKRSLLRFPSMPWSLAFLLGLALWAAPAAKRALAADAFVLIVHADNPVASLKAEAISDLFLKKNTSWPDGMKAEPVDLADDSAVRDSFSRVIHQKATPAVKSYWQRLIFAGREVPPPEKASAAEVMSFVRAHRAAVGYVPAGTALVAGVKAVAVRP